VEALDESCIKDCFQDYMCHPVFSTNEFDSGVHLQKFGSCRSSGVAGEKCLLVQMNREDRCIVGGHRILSKKAWLRPDARESQRILQLLNSGNS
jgi:hypothetical protein